MLLMLVFICSTRLESRTQKNKTAMNKPATEGQQAKADKPISKAFCAFPETSIQFVPFPIKLPYIKLEGRAEAHYNLQGYFLDNLQYPKAAIAAGTEGMVHVSVLVDSEGNICNAKIERGIGYGCNEEALRLVGQMPKWDPEVRNGMKINAEITIKVPFNLENNKDRAAVNRREIFICVEQMPEFRGNIKDYLQQNLKYPEQAKVNKIQGAVDLSMVIEADGRVTNIAITKSLGYGCDEEAVRLISSMAKWAPGEVGGRAVPVRISLPVRFKLDN